MSVQRGDALFSIEVAERGAAMMMASSSLMLVPRCCKGRCSALPVHTGGLSRLLELCAQPCGTHAAQRRLLQSRTLPAGPYYLDCLKVRQYLSAAEEHQQGQALDALRHWGILAVCTWKADTSFCVASQLRSWEAARLCRYGIVSSCGWQRRANAAWRALWTAASAAGTNLDASASASDAILQPTEHCQLTT